MKTDVFLTRQNAKICEQVSMVNLKLVDFKLKSLKLVLSTSCHMA